MMPSNPFSLSIRWFWDEIFIFLMKNMWFWLMGLEMGTTCCFAQPVLGDLWILLSYLYYWWVLWLRKKKRILNGRVDSLFHVILLFVIVCYSEKCQLW
jgi:hypothetical protein